MMHRGDLAEIRIDDVLRTAATERLTGGIELDGEPLLCVYLDGGAVYLAARREDEVVLTVEDDMDDAAYEAACRDDEERLRPLSVAVLAEALARHEGWYFFHQLTEHPAQGLWGWSVESLLAEAAAPRPAPVAPGPTEVDPSTTSPREGAPVLSAAVDDVTGLADETSDRPAPGAGAVDGRPPARLAALPIVSGPGGVAPAPRAPSDGTPSPTSAAGGEDVALEAAVPVEGDPGAVPAVDTGGDGDEGAARWRLNPAAPTGPLDAASWAVLVAMAGPVDPVAVAARLGRSVEETQTAFGRLVASGVLVAPDGHDRGEAPGGRVPGLAR